MLTKLYELRLLHLRCRKMMTHVIIAQICKILHEEYDKEVTLAKAQRQRVFSALKIMSSIRTIVKRRG